MCCSVGDVYIQVRNDGTLVTRVDRIGWIRGVGTSKTMVPLRSDSISSLCVDDDGRDRLMIRIDTTIADHVIGGNIRYRLGQQTSETCPSIGSSGYVYPIIVWHTDAVDMPLIHAVDINLL